VTEAFGSRLRKALDVRGPLCVGIDPHPGLLRDWGLADDPAGLERFAQRSVEALGSDLAVLKPQSACFERHGARGIAVLERVIRAARSRGALVLLDAKRGDIGSTVQAYADAYLDPTSTLAVDAVTAHPFLGVGSLDPLLDAALRHRGGVFVLALTSNPQGREVQLARTRAGATVAGTVLRAVAERNRGVEPLGSIGVVVGATVGDAAEDLDVNGPILVPGLGAQGATVDDVRRLFAAVHRNTLPSVSRSVLAAGPDPRALRDAALALRDELREALT
jgi:orotidine 5'-phosphate decarboxylase subfamily 2